MKRPKMGVAFYWSVLALTQYSGSKVDVMRHIARYKFANIFR
jgi:hypothetical protein